MLHDQAQDMPNDEERHARRSMHDDWRTERRERRRVARYARPFHGLFLGLTLTLLGTLFLMNRAGWLAGGTWWQALLIGLGAVAIIDGLVHYRVPVYRWGSYGKFLVGVVLILIGALFVLGFSQWWPAVLVVAGLALLLRPIWHR